MKDLTLICHQEVGILYQTYKSKMFLKNKINYKKFSWLEREAMKDNSALQVLIYQSQV